MSDRDTARSNNLLRSRQLGIRHCNKVFIDTCGNFEPDFILFCHADIISPASLQKVKGILPRVKMAQFNVDPIFRPHNIAMIQAKLPYMDATFITTAGEALKRFHSPDGVVSFVPNPIDSAMEWPRCHERSDQPHDVFWSLRAEKGSYPGDPRIEFPLYLEQSRKTTIDYHGMNGKAELFGAAYYRQIEKARMGLNISVVRTWGDTPHATDEGIIPVFIRTVFPFIWAAACSPLLHVTTG